MAKNNKNNPSSMEELLAIAGHKIKSFSRGQKVKAKLIEVTDRSAVFDIGGKSEGMVVDTYFLEAKKLIENLKPGDEVSATIVEPENRDGVALLSLRGAAQDELWRKIKKAQENGEIVEVVVKSINPHGLLVALDNETAFIPSSQIGKDLLSLSEDAIGKHIKTKVVDFDETNSRIVLSEKAVSEAADIKKIQEAFAAIKEGDKFDGTVTTVTNFGAFVEIKVPVGKQKIKVEGLVHVSELSWGKVGRASEVIATGDKVKVKVIGIDKDKLSLSIKQAETDPWSEIDKKYHKDDKVSGNVVKVSDFGAFVELEPGIEGLIHITKIPPGLSVKTGQNLKCYIEEINKEDKRLSLGLVITSEKPLGYK